ncbi:hypothetical protein F4604DRAFT_1920317 [Suillus subluteus]|nr:hypothetical protein F4604DRAFT_1920317 [Suillus subluteus]
MLDERNAPEKKTSFAASRHYRHFTCTQIIKCPGTILWQDINFDHIADGRPLSPSFVRSAHSLTSSFTLSFGTTVNSPASSALFDSKPCEDASNNAFAVQLVLQGRGREVSDEDIQQQKWTKLISDHKQLTEMMHNLMEISIAPSILASLCMISNSYKTVSIAAAAAPPPLPPFYPIRLYLRVFDFLFGSFVDIELHPFFWHNG